MPILAGQLVQDQQLVSVPRDESLTRALTLMIEHDFSQLPVVDSEGHPLGIVTCASIAKALLHLGAKVDELRVDHALVKLPTHPAEEDLLYLLDTILKASAVFVVDTNDKLVGIITEYDTTQYFRQRAEDLVLINDIEDNLKRHLQIAYNAQGEESAELRDAIGNLSNSLDGIRKKSHASLKTLSKAHDLKPTPEELDSIVDKHFPLRDEPRSFTDLTLGEFIQLAQKNWAKLEPSFGLSQVAWSKMMDDIRLIRNKLFHFKGDTSAVERNRLQFCANWYVNHPPESRKEAKVAEPIITVEDDTISQPEAEIDKPKGLRINLSDLVSAKYKGIIKILEYNDEISPGSELQVSINLINGEIGGGLPKAAREHLSWWIRPSVYSKQWLRKGWRAISLDANSVTFRREQQPEITKPINLDESWEVSYWCAVFDCTEEQLREAIRIVGNSPSKVDKYLSVKEVFPLRAIPQVINSTYG